MYFQVLNFMPTEPRIEKAVLDFQIVIWNAQCCDFLYFIWVILHFYTLFIFLEENAWNIFFILYWKDFTSIFQDGDCRPYWVLPPSKIEEWSHLVNLLASTQISFA